MRTLSISSSRSLTVWCVTSRNDAALLGHTITPMAAHPQVKHVVVLHTGSSRPACYGELQRACAKIHEFHQDFGDDLHRPLSEGGFDQVSARNVALGIAEAFGDRWLLQFDADDYYDPSVVDLLSRVPARIRAVRCACYHLLDAASYWLNDQKMCYEGPTPLINPHIRIWRNDVKRRFSICPTSSAVEPNTTRHCGVDFSDLSAEEVESVSEPVHLHLHYLLAKSDPGTWRRPAPLPGGAMLPEALLSFVRDRAGRARPRSDGDLSTRVAALRSPVSLIPHADETLVHFPLRGVAFLADRNAATMIEKLRDGVSLSSHESRSPALASLASLRLIGGEPDPLPTVKALQTFEPTEATLIFTESCNLGCSYCYASSRPAKGAMPWPVARAAIDLVVGNATKRDDRSCSMRYIGGGEPTLQWGLVQRATAHAREISRAANVRCGIRLITNGTLLTADRVDWIADHLDFVTLSFDILPELQAERSFVGGKDTHARLLQTIRLLCRRGVQFHIRTTVTKRSAGRLVEMLWYAYVNTGATSIRFEPLAEVGRGAGSEVGKPAEDVFVEQFAAARRLGRALGVEVTCKMVGNVHRAAARFCEAEFSVGPDGMISACHRYSRPDHDNADTFRYGSFDGSGFTFDMDRLNRVRGINVHTFRQCDTCFARWNCAGGCLSARMGEGVPLSEGPLCHLTREVLKTTILESFPSDRGERA